MEVSLSHYDWRVIRQVLRTRKPSTGHSLRLDMSRRTKDGTFLDGLVHWDLLQLVSAGDTPLDSTYALTERGKYAAEYGVYQIDWEEYKALAGKAKPEAEKRGRGS